MKIFDTTTALAAATLTAGQMVSVKEVGEYRIKASGSGITLANGNIAVPVASGTAVNVKQFGADPTGVADSTAAIQAAIDSGAGTVVFTDGSYLVEGQINLADNLTLMGYGATIVLGTTAQNINRPFFKNFPNQYHTSTGTPLATKSIKFIGLTFDGQDTGVAASTVPDANMHGSIIALGGWDAGSGVTGVLIDSCSFKNFAGSGVFLWHSNEVIIRNCNFTDFFANTSLSVGSGIDLHHCTRTKITGNTITHTSTGLSWHGMVVLDWTTGSSEVVIDGNIITDMNGGDGISCEGNIGDNLSNSVICNNVVKDVTGQGIGIDRCSRVTVNHNQIISAGIMGILFTDTEYTIIDGNTITDTAGGGIVGRSGIESCTITNNQISDITYYNSSFEGHGIEAKVTSSTDPRGHIVSGNIIKTTAGAGIYTAGQNVVCSNNFIYDAGTSASVANTLRAGIICQKFGNYTDNIIVSAGNTVYGMSTFSGNLGSMSGNKIRGTFTSSQYYIAYRGTGIYHNFSIDIDEAEYDASTNVFRGRYNGTPAGYWYQQDMFYTTNPTASGFIGSVCVSSGTTWKTFGPISA